VRLICLLCVPLWAGGEEIHHFQTQVGGGALLGRTVAAWGDGVVLVPLDGGPARKVNSGRYERGGCAFEGGLFLNESPAKGNEFGRAVYLAAPSGTAALVDTGASFRDCREAELFGRRGVLVTHRQMQIRFYERPERTGERWPYREIYSIYTASAQSGLALMDVDRDGRVDILHGNYWIQSPEEFELPWRLFAFNNWWDTARSAMLRIAIKHDGSIVAAESEASPARFSRFQRPENPRQFWHEASIRVPRGLRKPAAIAMDGGVVLVGEDAGGKSRLMAFDEGEARVLATSRGYLEIWPEESLALTRNSIQRYRRK
jgi:hypothetical protein